MKEKKQAKNQNAKNASYFQKISIIKNLLPDRYSIKFPVVKDSKAEVKLRMILYEQLSDKDKKMVNFNKNYEENRYKEDQKLLSP